jgi:hypothetical protein
MVMTVPHVGEQEVGVNEEVAPFGRPVTENATGTAAPAE